MTRKENDLADLRVAYRGAMLEARIDKIRQKLFWYDNLPTDVEIVRFVKEWRQLEAELKTLLAKDEPSASPTTATAGDEPPFSYAKSWAERYVHNGISVPPQAPGIYWLKSETYTGVVEVQLFGDYPLVLSMLPRYNEPPEGAATKKQERILMQEPRRYDLSVLFLEHEGQGWVAQCLQYDIAAQGATFNEAMKFFERTVIAQMVLDLSKSRMPFEGIRQAPARYWQEFEEAERLADPKPFRLPDDIPPGFVIAAQDRRLHN